MSYFYLSYFILSPRPFPRHGRQDGRTQATPTSLLLSKKAACPAQGSHCTRGRVRRASRRPPQASGEAALPPRPAAHRTRPKALPRKGYALPLLSERPYRPHSCPQIHRRAPRAVRHDRQESGGARPLGGTCGACGQSGNTMPHNSAVLLNRRHNQLVQTARDGNTHPTFQKHRSKTWHDRAICSDGSGRIGRRVSSRT